MEQKRIFDRRNKGGRPKKGAADKLKYRLTVKMATSDYYTLKGKANNLNQLAHKANAAGFATVKMECRVLVARIEEVLNLILL